MGVRVRERPKGSGTFWVYINHKGRRKAVKVGKEKAANQVAEKIQARIKLGQPFVEENSVKATVEEYFKQFDRVYLQTAVRESTAGSYRTNFKVHIIPAIGKLRLDQVDRARVEDFVAELVADKKLAKATIATIVRELCSMFSHAIKRKVITENPARALGQLYSQAYVLHEKIEPLTPDEVPVFLKAAREQMPSETRTVRKTQNGVAVLETVTGKRNWSEQRQTLFLTAIHTGVRVGELLAIEWPDIDWNGKFLSVERGYDRVRRKVVPTKSKKHRRVDLSDEVLEALRVYRRYQMEQWFSRNKAALIEKGLWDNVVKAPKVVFCNEDGGYRDCDNILNRHFNRCLDAAGLKRRRFHDLRHTYASLLLTAGAPIAYVSEQMGHASIELTVKRYGHLQPGANRRFVNNLPGVLAISTEPAKEA